MGSDESPAASSCPASPTPEDPEQPPGAGSSQKSAQLGFADPSAATASSLPAHRLTASRLLREQAAEHRGTLILSFAAVCGAALCEGGTLGLLALAVSSMAEPGRWAAKLETAGAGGLSGTAYQTLADLESSLGNGGLFLFLIGVAVAQQLLRSGLQFAGSAWVARLQADVEGNLRSRIFRHLLAVSHAQASRYGVGELSAYPTYAGALGKVLQQVGLAVGQLMLALASLGVMFWISWPLTLWVLAALGVLSLGVRKVIRRIRGLADQNVKATTLGSRLLVEQLAGLRLIRLFSQYDAAQQRVDRLTAEAVESNRRVMVWQASIAPVVESTAVLGAGLFLAVGAWVLGVNEPGAMPRLAAFVVVLYRLTPRISQINACRASIHSHWPMVERTAELLRRDDKTFEPVGGRPFPGVRSTIEFRNVSFRYSDDRPWALRDVSFTAHAGQFTALVGRSGAGKSTALDLLLRLYDPTSGSILIDGVDLRDYDLRSWRERLGVVAQDVFVFHGTIRDNIAFGRPEASPAEVLRAARTAHLDEAADRMPQGYDTLLGERGHGLSGGQLQRLAIARAVVRSPEVLVLDEATSALDGESEQHIQAALAAAGRERTVWAVAHRLSTIAAADRILTFDEGRLVEQGSHDELLAADGLYAGLWRIQADSEGVGLGRFGRS